ncbi:DUF58 domain-containing protein [Breznakiellaceae bacterium SP9]
MRAGPGLFAASIGLLCLGGVAVFYPHLSLVWFISLVTLVPFIIGDALFLRACTAALTIERELKTALSLGVTYPVNIRLTRSSKQGLIPFDIRLFDIYPAAMECSAFPVRLNRKLLCAGELILRYQVRPLERGPWEFSCAHLLFASPLRFWRRKVVLDCLSRGKTYPNFAQERASAKDIIALMEHSGIKNVRKRGQGLEFRSLREFTEGDSIKAIDWHATSRNLQSNGSPKLIVREYQEEQDQQVLFILDTGYRLHRLEDEFLQFDSALGAVILLAYTALKQGDSVAASTFGNTDRWLPPRKGIRTLPAFINSLYDLQSAPVPSSPFSALESALKHLTRRTLIILLSNFHEEDGESLSWILRQIKKRHLLLLVSLKEKGLEYIAQKKTHTPEEAIESAAAFSYLASRRRLYQSWEHAGILTLEAAPDRLCAALISRYLEVKKSGKL